MLKNMLKFNETQGQMDRQITAGHLQSSKFKPFGLFEPIWAEVMAL